MQPQKIQNSKILAVPEFWAREQGHFYLILLIFKENDPSFFDVTLGISPAKSTKSHVTHRMKYGLHYAPPPDPGYQTQVILTIFCDWLLSGS